MGSDPIEYFWNRVDFRMTFRVVAWLFRNEASDLNPQL